MNETKKMDKSEDFDNMNNLFNEKSDFTSLAEILKDFELSEIKTQIRIIFAKLETIERIMSRKG